MAVSPGRGSQMSISSPASTGTCARVMSRRMAKAFCEPRNLVGEVGLVLGEAPPIPDLEVVARADDDDLARRAGDAGVLEELRAESDAARRVELCVERAAAEEA